MFGLPPVAVEITIPSEPGWIPQARSFVRKFTEEAGLPEDAAFEVLVAMEEAAVNACCHGRRGPEPGEIKVSCGFEGDEVLVEVADEGPGFDVNEVDVDVLPDTLASDGRGIYIMHQLMDDVDIQASSGGTVVRMRRRIDPEGSEGLQPQPQA